MLQQKALKNKKPEINHEPSAEELILRSLILSALAFSVLKFFHHILQLSINGSTETTALYLSGILMSVSAGFLMVTRALKG